MKTKELFIAASLVVGGWNVVLRAGEHPHEHPTSKEHPAESKKEHPEQTKKEHPKEHPKKSSQDKSFQENYEKVVKDYLAGEAAKSGGVFTLKDEVDNKDWKLQLTKVHKSKICMLQAGKVCFACADFKEVGGKNKLDLDFYANKSEDGKITIDKVMIHKVNGKPRFTYDKDNNIVPVK